MEIVSKFVIGSDQGVSDFLSIKKQSFISLHKDFVTEKKINTYIEEHFDERKTINELNDLSNQLIITYQDDIPVAYCLLKGSSMNPVFDKEKRITEIDFVILPEYDSLEVRNSLYTKFLSAAKFTDIVWINMLEHNFLSEFFLNKNFKFIENSASTEFSLPASILSFEIIR